MAWVVTARIDRSMSEAMMMMEKMMMALMMTMAKMMRRRRKGMECGEAARGAHSRRESEHDSTDTMVAH